MYQPCSETVYNQNIFHRHFSNSFCRLTYRKGIYSAEGDIEKCKSFSPLFGRCIHQVDLRRDGKGKVVYTMPHSLCANYPAYPILYSRFAIPSLSCISQVFAECIHYHGKN